MTKCSGVARAPASQAPARDLPSIATTVPASPVRPDRRSAKAAVKRRNAISNAAGSRKRKTRLNVSWLGIPCGRASNSRRRGSLARPNSAMSQQVSAPHRVAAKAMTKISAKS